MYTVIRFGFDVIYWASRLTVDGAYYMIYGHQETSQERTEKKIQMLELKLEEKSFKERQNNQILKKLAKNQGIELEEMEIDIDEDTVLIT